jgi:uncharacterized protein
MFLKLLLFAVIGVVVYRALGGKVPLLDKEEKTPPQDTLTDDTLVECATCGTYVTVKESIVIGKKYYCSKTCIPD